jgi:methylmalonyl-CoA/ethylmalonyl-CoA epimerase
VFERFTEKARRVIFFARYEASASGSQVIEPEHLLLGLVREDRPLVVRLASGEEAVEKFRGKIEERVGSGQKISVSVELPLSRESKTVLVYARDESERLSHWHIGTEHLLLGLLRAKRSFVERILRESGIDLSIARKMIKESQAADSREGSEERAAVVVMAASHEAVRGVIPSPMFIDHIGIATQQLDEALKFWRDALGLNVVHVEEVAEQGVRVAMLPLGEPRIELLEPTGESSPVAKFMARRGAGIHHIAVRVPDIRAALERLKKSGATLIDHEPRKGAGGCLVAFVHPASTGGVLLELVEHAREESSLEPERH